jgi:hypothetical protein
VLYVALLQLQPLSQTFNFEEVQRFRVPRGRFATQEHKKEQSNGVFTSQICGVILKSYSQAWELKRNINISLLDTLEAPHALTPGCSEENLGQAHDCTAKLSLIIQSISRERFESSEVIPQRTVD